MAVRIDDTIIGTINDSTGAVQTWDKVTEVRPGVSMTDDFLLSGVFRKIGLEYFKARDTRRSLNAANYWQEGVLLTIDQINKFFTMAAQLNWIAFIPHGNWIFPEDWEILLGFLDLTVEGDATLFSTITSKREGVTHAIVPRIDLTRSMPFQDGFARVDAVDGRKYYDAGVLSLTQNRRVLPEWAPVKDVAINSYVKITAGVPAAATLAEVKAAGMLTELDLTEPAAVDPGIDGIYVVSGGKGATGGGYGHQELNQAKFPTGGKKVPIIIGTVLQRVAGVWSRLPYTRGFVTGGKIHFRHISFDDCRFYCITPSTPTNAYHEANVPGRDFIIEHCKFKNVSRICGLDRWGLNRTGTGGWQDYAGLVPGRENHFLLDGYSNFDNFILNDIEYSYIHTAAFWEIPPVQRLDVQNIRAHDCYTNLEHILYNPYGAGDDGYTNEPKSAVWNNLTFIRCRKYSPTITGSHILRNFGGNNTFSNITILDSTGICFYAGGGNNRFTNCHAHLHVEDYGSAVAALSWGAPEVYHLKGITYSNNNGIDIISASSCTGGWMTPVDQKLRSSSLRIANCEMSNFGHYDLVLASTQKMDRTQLWFISNFAKFQELNTEVNGADTIRVYDDEVITARGIYVYFDRRRDIWRRWHKGPMNTAGAIDRSTESSGYHDKDVDIVASNLRSSHLVKVATSAYDRIKMTGGTLELASNIVNATGSNFVNRLDLVGVRWVAGIGAQPTITTPNVKQFNALGCTIVTAPIYSPTILFTDICNWNNNDVVADPRYTPADLSEMEAPATTAMAAINFVGTGVSPILKIKGGSIDAGTARYGCVKFSGIKQILIDGVEAKMVMPVASGTLMTGGGGRRFFMMTDGADAIDLIEFRNMKVNGDNVTMRALILKLNTVAHATPVLTIGRVKFSGNSAFVGQGINKMVYLSSGTVAIGTVEYERPSDVIVDTDLGAATIFLPNNGKRHITASGPITVNDEFITVDTSSGNVTVTINAAALAYKAVTIQKISNDANQLIIVPASGTIAGQASIIYQEQWTGARLTAAGSNFIHV